MPKINVYVPDDMLAAMREAEIGVSPITQQAIAAELARLRAIAAAAATGDAIKAAAARLANDTSEEDEMTETKQEGHADGVRWALESASKRELRRFQEDVYRERGPHTFLEGDWPTLFRWLGDDHHHLGQHGSCWLDNDEAWDDGFIEGAGETAAAILAELAAG